LAATDEGERHQGGDGGGGRGLLVDATVVGGCDKRGGGGGGWGSNAEAEMVCGVSSNVLCQAKLVKSVKSLGSR
jgi:hypothetical protein